MSFRPTTGRRWKEICQATHNQRFPAELNETHFPDLLANRALPLLTAKKF